MSFGRVLREIRTENEDSLRKLAEKTGINFTKINKIELGDIAIAEDTLNKFIEVYPLSVSYTHLTLPTNSRV